MKPPKLTEYDGWRNSAISIWFFEHYLQTWVNKQAIENGKALGSFPKDEDYLTYVKNAGIIKGIEDVINEDPFEEERESIEEESDEDREKDS